MAFGLILDADGDAAAVFSQDGWKEIVGLVDGDVSRALAPGYTLDESTVKP